MILFTSLKYAVLLQQKFEIAMAMDKRKADKEYKKFKLILNSAAL